MKQKIFKGYPYRMNLFLFIIISLLIFYTLLFKVDNYGPGIFIFVIGVEIVWYMISGQSENYFIVSSDRIEVRNTWYFWRHETYNIRDIQKIQLYTPMGERFMLTFNTTFKTRRGYASTLNKDQINQLQKCMIELGLTVENHITMYKKTE